jgi:hypothetical protein
MRAICTFSRTVIEAAVAVMQLLMTKAAPP